MKRGSICRARVSAMQTAIAVALPEAGVKLA
jgi:hypothetical protein